MKTKESFVEKGKESKTRITFIILGTLSVLWFLIRVIPKPSRATYPCQRAAFPIASTFVIWLTGTLLSYLSFKKARKVLATRKLVAIGLASLGMIMFFLTYVVMPSDNLKAKALYILQEQPVLETAYNVETDQLIDPQATVAIVRSEQDQAEDIDAEELETMIRQAVEMAGGLEDIISDGDVVVLKPNIVSFSAPNETLPLTANGMITDWRVVATVAELVRELNPTGTILVMEGSAGNTEQGYSVMNYNTTSMPDVDEFLAFDQCSGDWMEYDAPELSSATLPDGEALYPNSKKPYNSDEYYYNKTYFEADVVISLPVLKNHETAGITGAVKNLAIGATPTNIYGNYNGSNGRWLIISHDAYYMHQWLHDFYYLRPADFAIMDGLQGWNNGPVFNHGSTYFADHQENMRVILASKDAIAMDAIEGLLMGDDPRDVTCLVYLDNSGLGCADPLAIRVLGTEVSDIKKSFPHDMNKTVCTYTDFDAPDVRISSMSLVDEILEISFTNPTRISSVEMEIDEVYYPQIVISEFDDIALDMTGISYTENSKFTIYANDQYLNTTVFSYDGTSLFPDHVETLEHNGQFTTYPNPAKEWLFVSLNDGFIGDIEYTIYSMNGQVMISGKLEKLSEAMHERINIAELNSGSYLLKLDAGKTQYTRQIIKQ